MSGHEGVKWSEAQREAFESRYGIDYSFFSVPSSLYYFLGYLAGDGGAWSNGHVSVGSCSDPYIIYKFRDLFAPNHKVLREVEPLNKDGSRGVQYSLSIGQEKFWNAISSFDVKNPSIFQRVPPEFLTSFILGFFDAEGSVEVVENKTCLGVQVLFYQNNTLYLEALSSVLVSWGLSPAPITVDKKGCSDLRLRLEDSLRLLEKLYISKGDLYLCRKHNSYRRVVESRKDFSIAELRLVANKRAWISRRVKMQLFTV